MIDATTLRQAIALEKALQSDAKPPEVEETFSALGWTPFPKQQMVVDAIDEGAYYVLGGGAASGGKSTLGRNLAIALCRKHPGVRIGIFRRTYPELHRTHEIPVSMLPRSWGVWRAEPHEFRFNNGSILELGSVEREPDLVKFQSAEYVGICFDECTEFTWQMITFLSARVRSTDPTAPRFILMLTNPGGVSHAEIKSTFVDPADPGTRFNAKIGESTFPAVFIPFRLEDNPAVQLNDPTYRDRLMAMPSHLRRAWLYGDWDVHAGSFFDEWLKEKHVVAPFELPKAWPRWRSVDFGYASPFCCLWGARDNDGNVYVYREAYETRHTDIMQARLIMDLSLHDPTTRFTVCDPSMFSKQPNGISIAQTYVNEGLRNVIPGNNDRKAGWQRVRQFLRWDDDNLPKLRVFSTCKNLIRTMPLQQSDRFKPEDLDTDLEDHPEDALRYLLMGGSVRAHRTQLLDFEVVA